jgi:Holliday junction resolvase RusA-like endonuclease
LTLPWSALVSDNRKYAAALRGKGVPMLIHTEQYRNAKKAAKARAVDAMTVEGQRFPPLARPLALVARVWVPDNRHGHDVANFAKCAHDALEGIVYSKDEWLHDVRWIRAGVDVDRPRAEIEVAPL